MKYPILLTPNQSRMISSHENARSAAEVKIELPVLVRTLKSSILSSTSFQMDETLRGVVSAVVEQSRRNVNIVV